MTYAKISKRNTDHKIPLPAVSMESLDEKLYSNRLILRRVKAEDLPLLVKWSQSKASCGEFLSPEYYDTLQLEQKLNTGVLWSAGEKLFLVETREGEPLGTLHYWRPTWKINTAVVAVKIANPGERGKGYGTEAQKFLIMYLFEKAKVQFTEMYIDIDNLSQQRCLVKLGFEHIESLTFDDKDLKRVGHLYRLDYQRYKNEPIYRYHYE